MYVCMYVCSCVFIGMCVFTLSRVVHVFMLFCFPRALLLQRAAGRRALRGPRRRAGRQHCCPGSSPTPPKGHWGPRVSAGTPEAPGGEARGGHPLGAREGWQAGVQGARAKGFRERAAIARRGSGGFRVSHPNSLWYGHLTREVTGTASFPK